MFHVHPTILSIEKAKEHSLQLCQYPIDPWSWPLCARWTECYSLASGRHICRAGMLISPSAPQISKSMISTDSLVSGDSRNQATECAELRYIEQHSHPNLTFRTWMRVSMPPYWLRQANVLRYVVDLFPLAWRGLVWMAGHYQSDLLSQKWQFSGWHGRKSTKSPIQKRFVIWCCDPAIFKYAYFVLYLPPARSNVACSEIGIPRPKLFVDSPRDAKFQGQPA